MTNRQKEAEAARTRLMRTCHNVISECDQCLRDIAWWNNNRTECPPIDPEGFRVKGLIARAVLKCLEERARIPDDLAREFFNPE
jgi:hypothetical protein